LKKIFYFLIFFSITFCQTTSEKKDTEVDETTMYQIQITQGYLANCMYPQALIEIKKALVENPEHYLINDKIGVVYYLMKEYQLSESYFRKSLSLNNEYSEARMNLARVLIQKKKFDEALLLVQEVENDLTYTDPSKVYATLGELHYFKKNRVLSKKYFDSTQEINPKICSNYYHLGKYYMDQQNYSQAIKNFKLTSSCQVKNKEHKSCWNRNVDQYYYQGISELKLRQKKNGAKSLSVFLKLAKNDNILKKQAEKLLKEQL